MAMSAAAPLCYAVPLPVGGAVAAVAEPEPSAGATLVGTTGPVPFFAPTFTGTLTSSVYNNDSTNPNGLAAYTFTYTIHNDATSIHELHRFTVSSFETFTTDVSYSSLSAGREPFFVDRSPGIGDVVGFNFVTPIPIILPSPGAISPGLTSRVLVIQTNAFDFTPTTASVIDGVPATVESLAPKALVPEPSTLVLSGMGLGFMVLRALHRRRRQA